MLFNKFQELSKQALRNRDSEARRIYSNVLAKYKEIEKSTSFEGWTDAKELDVLKAYVKSLKKSLDAVRGSALEAQYQTEIDAFQEYLPKLLGPEETRALVAPLAEKANGRLGMFMGMVLKAHKDQVDPNLVRQIGQELGLR